MECQMALQSDQIRTLPSSPSTPNNTEHICSAVEMPTQNPRVKNYMVTKVRDSELGSQFSENHLDPEGLTDDSDCESKSAQPTKRPLVERIWKYIKAAWSGVTGSEPILEDLELPHRYRPQNMKTLCDATGFSISEMKRIYRGFKTECPSGLITEEAFHSIYSRFFPQGAPFIWSDIRGYVHCSGEWAGKKKVSKKEQKALDLQNAQAALSSYSHYVFSTLDRNDSGVITFQDFVVGLSILIRGTLEEKLRWTFSLYDQDRDGVISREEMEDVVGSVFDLMGRTGDPISEEAIITERVDQIFQKMDLNGDGVVSIEEFLESCQNDETISRSVQAFTNVHI